MIDQQLSSLRRQIPRSGEHITLEFQKSGHVIVERHYAGGSSGYSLDVPSYLCEERLPEALLDFLEHAETQGHRVTSIHVYPAPLDAEGNPCTGALFTSFVAIPFLIRKDGMGIKRIMINSYLCRKAE